MKRFLYLLVALLGFAAFSSCEDDDGKLDTDAKIWIRGVDHAGNKSLPLYSSAQKTVHELLVEGNIELYCPSTGAAIAFDFEYNNIDTINDRICYIAGNINGIEGNELLTDTLIFFRSRNSWNYCDTIGYIPAEQMRQTHDILVELFAKEDWKAVYEYFENGMQFYPCTGEEYLYVHGMQ